MRALILFVSLGAVLAVSGCKKDAPTQPQTSGGGNVVFDHWGSATLMGDGYYHYTGYCRDIGTAVAGNVQSTPARTIWPSDIGVGAMASWMEPVGVFAGDPPPSFVPVFTWN